MPGDVTDAAAANRPPSETPEPDFYSSISMNLADFLLCWVWERVGAASPIFTYILWLAAHIGRLGGHGVTSCGLTRV